MTPLEIHVRSEVSKMTRQPEATLDGSAALFDLGLSSLQLVELIIASLPHAGKLFDPSALSFSDVRSIDDIVRTLS